MIISPFFAFRGVPLTSMLTNSVAVFRKARENLLRDVGYMRAVRLGAILGIVGVAAHSLVDFGLHIIVNAVVFLTLIMMATTRLEGLSHAKAQRSKEA